MAFTAKQKKFIEAYHGNATIAATVAGYSHKTAGSMGSQLLKNINIAQAIKERNSKEVQTIILTRKQRQEFWSKVVVNPDEDVFARLKASELLGKSEADFTMNINHSSDLSKKTKDQLRAEIAELLKKLKLKS